MRLGTLERVVHWWPKIRTRLFTMLISGRFGEIGLGARVTPPFRFANLHQISLGDHVLIHQDCWITVLGGLGAEDSIKLIIKSHAGIGMGATIAAAEKVVIGEYALLAR